MTVTAEEIVNWYHARRHARAPEINMAQKMRDAYNGDLALPLPELNRNEQASIANLVKVAINQNAVRLASTIPSLYCPPSKSGNQAAEKRADLRRRALVSWWEMNDWKKKQYRRARHFISYGSSPVIIRPDFKRGIPQWQVLDPLCAFPSPSADMDDMEPYDLIFSFTRPLSWLRTYYPDKIVELAGADNESADQLFELVEYVCDEEHVLVVMGRASQLSGLWTPSEIGGYSQTGTGRGKRFVELCRLPNRAGICTAVVPGRVTLDRRGGQFDGMLPMFIKRARLAALEEIAIEKGVFENEWFVQNTPDGDIVTEADGREGIVGHVKGGTMMWHTSNPAYMTPQALDRLERQERVEGTVPAEFAAESASNVRTDRRGNTIMSATIDFSHAETHDLLAESYGKEFARAIAVQRANFGDQAQSFFVSWKGAKGTVDYVPNKVFSDSEQVIVRWAMPGSDVNTLTVGGGQRVGMGTLSKRDFMELDPLVDDVEQTMDRVTAEALEAAMLSSIQQQAAAGAIPPADMARIMELVVTNQASLADAVTQVHQEAQARQATSGPPGTPEAPAAPGSPEAQPGLGAVGPGGAAGTIDATPNEAGLSALMSALRGPGRAGALEHGTAAA